MGKQGKSSEWEERRAEPLRCLDDERPCPSCHPSDGLSSRLVTRPGMGVVMQVGHARVAHLSLWLLSLARTKEDTSASAAAAAAGLMVGERVLLRGRVPKELSILSAWACFYTPL